ncbi:hypothetical protein ACVXG7_13250 [Enterobacter hormaechei]
MTLGLTAQLWQKPGYAVAVVVSIHHRPPSLTALRKLRRRPVDGLARVTSAFRPALSTRAGTNR